MLRRRFQTPILRACGGLNQNVDTVEEVRAKHLAAGLSLGYNVLLTALKVVAAVLTGSVSLLSESVHSATDIVASAIALVSVRAAAAPPDDDHPYGHGKIESLASFVESLLLLGIVVYIVYESAQKLIHHVEVKNLHIGLWVMAFSAVGSFAVGKFVTRIGDRSQSLALRSNGQHLIVDFWTSVGVLTALGLTTLTGWTWTDPVFALGLALWIARGALHMAHESVNELIDRTLPVDELGLLHDLICAEPEVISYHKLRARHSGRMHYVEVHIVVPREWTLVQAHDLADRIEKQIANALSPAQPVIHIDPFDPARVG